MLILLVIPLFLLALLLLAIANQAESEGYYGWAWSILVCSFLCGGSAFVIWFKFI